MHAADTGGFQLNMIQKRFVLGRRSDRKKAWSINAEPRSYAPNMSIYLRTRGI